MTHDDGLVEAVGQAIWRTAFDNAAEPLTDSNARIAARAAIAAVLEWQSREIVDVLAPIAKYAMARERAPLGGVGDSVHAIHMGTEHEAEITFPDVQAVARLYKKMGGP